MIVYIDSDGVVADFAGLWNEVGSTWEAAQTVPHFFKKLKVLPGAREMVFEILKMTDGKAEVLTASPLPTGHFITTKQDKIEWWSEHITNKIKVNVVKGWKDKVQFLKKNTGSILIDDHQRNVDDWMAHGGFAILHKSPEDTLRKLKLLSQFK